MRPRFPELTEEEYGQTGESSSMSLKKLLAGLALKSFDKSAQRLSPEKAGPIEAAISPVRLATYRSSPDVADRGLRLYLWNANVSGCFLFPLHICEVAVRNAVADAIGDVYGGSWPWDGNFRRSLPDPGRGYSPRADLESAAAKASSPGQAIPELKFAFWQNMFTKRHDKRIWAGNLARIMPNLPAGLPLPEARRNVHDLLNDARLLRNRIAHHEPILNRDLIGDYGKILALIGYVSQETAEWVDDNQMVTACIANRPEA